MIRSRALTAEIDVSNGHAHISEEFSKRVEGLLNKGFDLSGSIKLTFNQGNHKMKAGQGIHGHFDGDWDGFVSGADIPTPEPLPTTATLYRLVVGKDDSLFCKTVEEMCNNGWEEQGEFALSSTLSQDIAAQALVKKLDRPYPGFDLNA
jgi:hypothetical protein